MFCKTFCSTSKSRRQAMRDWMSTRCQSGAGDAILRADLHRIDMRCSISMTFLLCCCLLLLTTGCDKTKQVTHNGYPQRRELPQDPNLPKITDPRFAPSLPKPPDQSRGEKKVVLRVSRLDFEMRQNLNHALRFAKPATDRQTTQMLKEHGLRYELLPMQAFEEFAKEVGDPLNIWRSNLQMAYDGTPISTTPRITKRITIDLTDNQLSETFTTDEGWFRFMFAIQQAKLGSLLLNIPPQHYLPQTSVKVRSPRDKIWDGTLFDQIKSTVDLPNSHLLILRRVERPTLAEFRDANQPGLFDAEPGDDATKPTYLSMGDLLLTYDQWGHHTQMVYIIARVK